jgi:hypothetical protein
MGGMLMLSVSLLRRVGVMSGQMDLFMGIPLICLGVAMIARLWWISG